MSRDLLGAAIVGGRASRTREGVLSGADACLRGLIQGARSPAREGLLGAGCFRCYGDPARLACHNSLGVRERLG
ncbi:hypothetical protein BaRGS_00017947 [Batillaria attramentaria]|uniref:Uncharacterized protein n=1 Tax=Batillaria attramentaria TaxID=370345 RepID=A0ABD0KUZ3_9CAEN